jgi:hypothetical protein
MVVDGGGGGDGGGWWWMVVVAEKYPMDVPLKGLFNQFIAINM